MKKFETQAGKTLDKQFTVAQEKTEVLTEINDDIDDDENDEKSYLDNSQTTPLKIDDEDTVDNKD